MIVSMNYLPEGEKAQVLLIAVNKEKRTRLSVAGLCEGAMVKTIEKSGAGREFVIEVAGKSVPLPREDVKKIIVQY